MFADATEAGLQRGKEGVHVPEAKTGQNPADIAVAVPEIDVAGLENVEDLTAETGIGDGKYFDVNG